MAYARMRASEIEEAAGLLLALRREEIALEDLPDRLVPQSTSDVQRIIDATNRHIETPVRGWKIYCVYKPMQPVFFAPVYDLVADGGTIPVHLSGMRLIEPEIMFRVDQPIEMREAKYGHEELAERVTAIVGMEVVGGRFNPISRDDIVARSKSEKSNFGNLCDNIANNCIIVGDAIPDWRKVAFEDVRVTMTNGDRTLVDFVGGHPLDDPFLPLLVGVNRMRRHNALVPGDILVTSSSTSFFTAEPGIPVHTRYTGLGGVSATFAHAACRNAGSMSRGG